MNARLAALLSLSLSLPACGKPTQDVCSNYHGQTCIALLIETGSSGPTSIDELQVTPLTGFTLHGTGIVSDDDQTIPLPAVLAVLPETLTQPQVSMHVVGLASAAKFGTLNPVGEATLTTPLTAGQHVESTVELEAALPYDLATP